MITDRPAYVSFDRVADCYERTRYIPPAVLADAAHLLVADARLNTHTPLLDAGIGTARFARYLRDEGATVVGADISLAMLEQAKRRSPDIALVRADLRRLPFGGGTFGAALVVHILHLIPDWTAVVRELRRVLRPGGPVYLGCEGGKRLRSRELFFNLASEFGFTRPNVGAQSMDAILEHLTATGAEVVQMPTTNLVWTARSTVRDMVETMRNNPYSHLWHIDSSSYARLMREFETRIRKSFASLDEVDEAPAYLSLWRATWPAKSAE